MITVKEKREAVFKKLLFQFKLQNEKLRSPKKYRFVSNKKSMSLTNIDVHFTAVFFPDKPSASFFINFEEDTNTTTLIDKGSYCLILLPTNYWDRKPPEN